MWPPLVRAIESPSAVNASSTNVSVRPAVAGLAKSPNLRAKFPVSPASKNPSTHRVMTPALYSGVQVRLVDSSRACSHEVTDNASGAGSFTAAIWSGKVRITYEPAGMSISSANATS